MRNYDKEARDSFMPMCQALSEYVASEINDIEVLSERQRAVLVMTVFHNALGEILETDCPACIAETIGAMVESMLAHPEIYHDEPSRMKESRTMQ